jgi:hypothetical protein
MNIEKVRKQRAVAASMGAHSPSVYHGLALRRPFEQEGTEITEKKRRTSLFPSFPAVPSPHPWRSRKVHGVKMKPEDLLSEGFQNMKMKVKAGQCTPMKMNEGKIKDVLRTRQPSRPQSGLVPSKSEQIRANPTKSD